MKYKPTDDHILIELDDYSMSPGGIHIPENSLERNRTQTGTVVAVGRGRINKDGGEVTPLCIEPGDQVWFNKFAGDKTEVGGKELHTVREHEIVGYVRP